LWQMAPQMSPDAIQFEPSGTTNKSKKIMSRKGMKTCPDFLGSFVFSGFVGRSEHCLSNLLATKHACKTQTALANVFWTNFLNKWCAIVVIRIVQVVFGDGCRSLPLFPSPFCTLRHYFAQTGKGWLLMVSDFVNVVLGKVKFVVRKSAEFL
jgi:hypothetical protein